MTYEMTLRDVQSTLSARVNNGLQAAAVGEVFFSHEEISKLADYFQVKAVTVHAGIDEFNQADRMLYQILIKSASIWTES